MPFYKTKLFFLCLIVLAALLVLFVVTGRKADAQRGLPERHPPVELALNKDTQERLKHALSWDFAFIPVYTLTISLIVYLAAQLTNARPRLTWLVISIVFFGGLVDVCENLTLLHVIKTSRNDAWATTASILGVAKYVFPAVAIIYAFGVGALGLLTRER